MKIPMFLAVMATAMAVTPAFAAVIPIKDIQINKDLELSTSSAAQIQPIKQPIKIPVENIIFDPILIPGLATSSDPGLPSWIGDLKPIPLPDIKIPPEMIKGPTITDINMSGDGKILLVTWTTDQKASSMVEWGSSSFYGKSLSDSEEVNSHAMAIPVGAGTWHIQISSMNVVAQMTKTGDITVVVPVAQNNTGETTSTTSSDPAGDGTVSATSTLVQADGLSEPTKAASTAEAIADTNAKSETSKAENGISTTNAILGGLAVLIAGVLIGVLVNRGKKQTKE